MMEIETKDLKYIRF